ncbi:hypothetical protein [Peribacillus sp. NPDC097295]|uniref:hypothetical protein n=1 Tax=Peribacillus sp. NPDC097295 TaxID=3364402 RepID=UPI00381C76E3
MNAFEKWMNENKLHLHPKTIQAYINTKGKIENHFKDTLLKDITKEAYKEFLKTFDYLNQTTN